MKKTTIFILIIMALPSYIFSMEEKSTINEEAAAIRKELEAVYLDTCSALNITNEEVARSQNAEKLYRDTVSAFYDHEMRYKDYKNNLKKAIPLIDTRLYSLQTHSHDPLRNAVSHGDYKFAQLLLEHGASPTFKQKMDRRSAFDALKYKFNLIYSNDEKLRKLNDLLESYLKEGEKIPPYEGDSPFYATDKEWALKLGK